MRFDQLLKSLLPCFTHVAHSKCACVPPHPPPHTHTHTRTHTQTHMIVKQPSLVCQYWNRIADALIQSAGDLPPTDLMSSRPSATFIFRARIDTAYRNAFTTPAMTSKDTDNRHEQRRLNILYGLFSRSCGTSVQVLTH